MYSTPYDDVWKTIMDKMPHLLIPLINEVFQEDHSGRETVTALQNEHMDSAAEKVISDSYLRIRDKHYHVECQSSPDGTMAIRMIEYDFLIGLKHAKKKGNEYTINYPQSCVLYLRHKESTPKFLTVHVNFPDGARAQYRIPVIRMQEYDLDEIFMKGLLCLLPYYIMRYEDSLHEINEDDEKLGNLLTEYQEIYSRLWTLKRERQISLYDVMELRTLIELLVNYLARTEQKIREGVIGMGGRVLTFPHDTVYEEGIAVGEACGKAWEKRETAFEMFGDGFSCEKVAKYIHETVDTARMLEKEWRAGGK